MVEGRFVVGFLLISMAAVILAVILGLRYLDGTLAGPDAVSTVLLVAIFIVFTLVASLFSFTDVLSRRRQDV